MFKKERFVFLNFVLAMLANDLTSMFHDLPVASNNCCR